MRLAIVADRIGWEERQLLAAAAQHDTAAFWVDDSSLCAGPGTPSVPEAEVYLMRGHSYTRSGMLAGLLEDTGRRVVNPAGAIMVCQDKLQTLRRLTAAGVPVPDYRLVLTRRDLPAAIAQLGLPCVLKPLFGGLGRRVLLVRDRDLAAAAYDYVEHFGQGFDRVLLAQRFHPGTDQRAVVIGGEVVAMYERVPDGDWRASVSAGSQARASRAGSEADVIRSLALRSALAVGTEICAVDLLAGRDAPPQVIEVNHVPMFRGAVQATGCDISRAIVGHLARTACLAPGQ
jgi:[lysine-biosynthesis-protein LysW]---L-2-aminoadipate ligase